MSKKDIALNKGIKTDDKKNYRVIKIWSEIAMI